MNRIHIIGRKNHGKTTLITELIEEFTRRGFCVGSIKHTHHHHELDTPGKDSHRHRVAGAKVVGILSPMMSAVFVPRQNRDIDAVDKYAFFEQAMSDCDLILVEGDTYTLSPKLEVWRSECKTDPWSMEIDGVSAIVSDDDIIIPVERKERCRVDLLVDWMIDKFQIEKPLRQREGV